jgi:hypothetical protein
MLACGRKILFRLRDKLPDFPYIDGIKSGRRACGVRTSALQTVRTTGIGNLLPCQHFVAV